MTSTPNPGQLSSLPGVNRYITGHDASGKAIVQVENPAEWSPFEGNSMAFTVAYTTSEFPADLNSDADLKAHERVAASGTLGLVKKGGTVVREVDFAPKSAPLMHRTQSLDYGVVLEGEIEMVLDSGETRLLKRGDVAVQRATMHGWRNPQENGWTRMLFVLQDCKPLVVGGQELGEDLTQAKGDGVLHSS
ncbi:cupin domain-containing protein [Aspergillus puulaauensis]|uniref:Cupin 2 conserved barrel domain-containing protein n=1 Tax=Aspergillus puulaauensis TaxID=1220207 RepID=A0A7R7XYB7_9EURO|nr:uncharacterized protein APUU_80273A [Aspergillus puulaauensis]BCS29970.1 hypothetical protein APUU_80273A [Aspergillus puulaauensis]